MSQPYHADERVTLWHGDCLQVLRADENGYDFQLGYGTRRLIPDGSVDAVVTDPPYGLANTDPQHVADTIFRWVNGDRDYLPGGSGFMGKAWDAFVPPVAVWDECLRVLKPGGHVLAFAGSRTVDLMTLGLRLAGFDIRDSIAWLYGSGFPKSLDVSKAIDKRPGVSQHPAFAAHLAERRQAAGLSRADVSERVVGTRTGACWNWEHHQFPEAKWWPALRDLLDLDEAKWGPIIAEAERQKIGVKAGNRLAVAPGQGEDRSAIDLDVTTHATPDAERWQGWGTALKPAFEPIVVARKPLAGSTVAANVLEHGTGALNIDACRVEAHDGPRVQGAQREAGATNFDGTRAGGKVYDLGRWPTNVVLDESQADELDQQSGDRPAGGKVTGRQDSRTGDNGIYGDTGGASRFFKVISQTPSDLVFLPVECEAWEQPGDASTRAANTSAGRSTESRYASSPIGGSGSKPTDPSPRGTRSTTGTTTPSTTTSTTSCASPPSGTTTTTSASASSTDGSTGSRSAAVSGATPTSPSMPSLSDERAPSTATAESAPRHTAESGSPATATSSTHDDARSEHADSTPEWPRFRYQAKAPTSERPHYTAADGTRVAHPTTKPLDLMRWLVRLVTPPGGTVLEPFAGSGTTVEACLLERFHCIAIERSEEYLPLVMARVHKRTNTVEAIRLAGDDGGLLDLIDEGQAS